MRKIEKTVIEWGREKGIIFSGNDQAEFRKIIEEVNELEEAIYVKEDKREILLEAGDVMIALTNLLAIYDLSVCDAYEAAYNKIKNRTGKTVNGDFIKD